MSNRIVQRLWVFSLLCIVGCRTATAEKETPSEPSPAVKATPPEPSPVAKDVGAAAPCAALRAVPADAVGFIHVRLADIWNSAACADVRPILAKAGPQALEIFEKKYLPAPSTLESITAIYLTPDSIGTSVFHGPPKHVSPVLAITSTKPFDREQIVKACGAGEDKFHDQTYFVVPTEAWAFHFIDDRTIVFASYHGLRRWFIRPAEDAGAGPLQAAWVEANQKHAVVGGFSRYALSLDSLFEHFDSWQKSVMSVGTILGGRGNPPKAPPPDEERVGRVTEFRVATPLDILDSSLYRALCLTLTVDLDSKLQCHVKVDFESNEKASDGEKAVHGAVKAAHDALVSHILDTEFELREGVRIIDLINQPPGNKPERPKPVSRDIDQFSNNVLTHFQLGLYRTVDEQLKALRVERKGLSVSLRASVPVNATSLVCAITALGTNANKTFTNVGDSIEAPTEAPKKSIDEKTSRTPEAVAPILPPGARAVPIRVRTDSIGDGFASLPASRVDVWFRVNQGNRGETAEMVLENVLVVAADMPHKNDKTTLVTLALMSGDASRLAEVQGRGGLFLALRRQEENEKK